jgi:DNA repair exonuclease SbcCD ATPase subunit
MARGEGDRLMLIRGIELKNFKRFQDFKREFEPGINVVKGKRNEIGKSTLLEGIIAALFYKPKDDNEEIRSNISWQLRSEGKYETSLLLEDEGKQYQLDKNFSDGTISLLDLDTGEKYEKQERVSRELKRMLGTVDSKRYLSTACIRQDQVSEISSGRKILGESLEQIITGEESALASNVMDRLDKRIAEMRKGEGGMAKSPGPLREFSDKIKALDKDIEQIRDKASTVEETRVQMREASERLEQVVRRRDELTGLLEKNTERMELEGKIKELEEEYEKADRLLDDIEELLEEKARAETELSSFGEFATIGEQIEEDAEKLKYISRNVERLNQDIEKRKKDIARTGHGLMGNRLLLGALAVLLTAGGVLAWINLASTLRIALGVILPALAILSAIRCAVVWERVAEFGKRIGDMYQKKDTDKGEERKILDKFACESADEFWRNKEAFDKNLSSKRLCEEKLSIKLGERNMDEIKTERNRLKRDLEDEREKLTPDLVHTAISPEKYHQYTKELRELEEQTKRLENEETKCNIRLESGDYRNAAETLSSMEENRAYLEDKLGEARRKLRIYEITRNLISQARDETIASSADRLAEEVQKNFAIFTDGKYDDVRIEDKRTLTFSVYSKEKGGYIAPEKYDNKPYREELSKGAIDEFYLACRLALVKLIYGDRKPPLILDDPFVNFDEARLARTLNFCRDMSRDYQFILFTLSDRYDSMVDKPIVLE